MVPLSQWLLFAGTALMVLMPGPNMIYLVPRSVSLAWRREAGRALTVRVRGMALEQRQFA